MKLFVLTPRVPWPLEKGDKLRAWHQIRILARKHEVCLCCLADSPVDQEAIEKISAVVSQLHIIRLNRIGIGLNLLAGAFSAKPYQVHYFYQRSAARKVRRIIEEFRPDHLYCQLIRSTEYVKNIHHIPKTLDYMDAFNAGHSRRLERSAWYLKPLLREEAKRLARYENLIFDYFDHHTIISAQDRDLIYHPRRATIHVVPNGVDTHFFAFNERGDRAGDVLFTGNMSYPPNVDCAKFLAGEVMPLIWKTHPETRLVIAGANPTTAVQQLAGKKVRVTGWVEDIRESYRDAGIFLAPMRIGTGLQNKILEAMSSGLPCVTSPLAAGALGVTHNRECLIADSADEVSVAALSLLDDPELRRRLARAAHEMVTHQFSWEASVDLLERIFTTAR